MESVGFLFREAFPETSTSKPVTPDTPLNAAAAVESRTCHHRVLSEPRPCTQSLKSRRILKGRGDSVEVWRLGFLEVVSKALPQVCKV